MNSVTPDISANPLFGTAIHSIGRACDQERIRAATLTERALVEQIEALGALAEHRRIVNEELAGQLQDLVAVKADAERALAERSVALKALENANRAIDRFTYAASHDLKAPLRGIGHVSDWLEEDLAPVLTEKSKEHLELLRGRVCRMEALIDGIIAYAGASRAKDLFEPIALAPLLDEVVATLAPAPGVVTMEIPDSMPLLWVQSVPFRQMWLNLVGNALKHGARDGAAIRLAVKDAGDAWELSVSDNGPGIALRYHQRIFGMFQTLKARDEVEGAGIGLAIVQTVVEERGGRVWVTSEPGKGATFSFTWPKS
jgi:signal transduction histidine kinase